MPAKLEEIGTGPTEELCLRVSAAALVRVTFPHPETGEIMLGLERTVTLDQNGQPGTRPVTAKPFGGGVRITQPDVVYKQLGDFHFDSPRSKAEQDFRILIRPADWGNVKHFCLNAFRAGQAAFLETDPARELAEEFIDTLQVPLSPSQYLLTPLELVVENEATKTTNLRAAHLPTVRIYTVFEARLVDPDFIQQLLSSSAEITDQKLAALADEDARKGGRGRANHVLALTLQSLINLYLELPPERRNDPAIIEGHYLESNVPAVLSEVLVPKYERFSF